MKRFEELYVMHVAGQQTCSYDVLNRTLEFKKTCDKEIANKRILLIFQSSYLQTEIRCSLTKI